MMLDFDKSLFKDKKNYTFKQRLEKDVDRDFSCKKSRL
jgi:hypothetical protein